QRGVRHAASGRQRAAGSTARLEGKGLAQGVPRRGRADDEAAPGGPAEVAGLTQERHEAVAGPEELRRDVPRARLRRPDDRSQGRDIAVEMEPMDGGFG